MESEAFMCFSIFTSEDWECEAVLEDGKAKAQLITNLWGGSAGLRLLIPMGHCSKRLWKGGGS